MNGLATGIISLTLVLTACGRQDRSEEIVTWAGWDPELVELHTQFQAEARAAGLRPRAGLVTAVFSDRLLKKYCPDDDDGSSTIGCCAAGFQFNGKLEAGIYIAEELRGDAEVIARHEFAHCEFGVNHDPDPTSILYYAPDRSVDGATGKPTEARLDALYEFISKNKRY
jgi:hypothetical protein